MNKAYRTRIAGFLFLLAVAMLLSVPAFAQPARPQNPPDISGEWRLESNEDPGQLGALGQPPLGDYLGIPFNDAGRLRAETSAESIWGTPEYQCRPHSAPHQWRGLGGARILKEQDPLTRDVRAYHIQFMRSLDWPIYMDGRPLDGLLDRRVGWKHPEGHDDPSQRWLPQARWPANHRHVYHD